MRGAASIGLWLGLLSACGPGPVADEGGDESAASTGTGDGDPGDGDGEGDSGDGDGAPGDGDGEPGDGDSGDGDATCDAAGFVGFGLAADGWGVGDFCDQVYTCVDEALGAALASELGLECGDSGFDGCVDPPVVCVFSPGGVVDEALFAQACAALELGAEAIVCAVIGP